MSHSTTTNPSVSGGEVTGPRFRTRERVHDRDDPHGVLVVLATLDVRCDRYELTEGVTVHSVHLDYEPSDRVVLCVPESCMESIVPGWRDLSSSNLRARVQVEHDRTPPGVRAFPASKLERYTAGNYTRSKGRVYCENCQTWVETPADWVGHIARGCDGV